MQSSSVVAEMVFAALSVFGICIVVLVSSTHLYVLRTHAKPHGAAAAGDACFSPSASISQQVACVQAYNMCLCMDVHLVLVLCVVKQSSKYQCKLMRLMEADMCLIT